MGSESNLRILWEGKLHLDQIRWNKNLDQEFELSPHFHGKLRAHWKNHIKAYPDDYDGSLLFLNDFHFKKTELLLDIIYMKFSTVIFIEKNKIPIKRGIGVLGVQYLVFSSDKKHIMIGKRTLDETYYPGAIAIPGGILEIEDLNRTPKKALMREAFEEIGAHLENDAYLTAMLVGWNAVSIAFLISAFLEESYDFDPNESIETDQREWEGNLKWFPIKDLGNLNKNELLDGLRYYQKRITENYSP